MLCKTLSIKADLDEWSSVHEAAHVVFAREYGFRVRWANLDCVHWKRGKIDSIDDPVIPNLLEVYAAGGAATVKYCGIRGTDKTDIDKTKVFLAKLGVSERLAIRMYCDAFYRAYSRLRRLEPKMERVAKSLLKHGHLSGREVYSELWNLKAERFAKNY